MSRLAFEITQFHPGIATTVETGAHGVEIGSRYFWNKYIFQETNSFRRVGISVALPSADVHTLIIFGIYLYMKTVMGAPSQQRPSILLWEGWRGCSPPFQRERCVPHSPKFAAWQSSSTKPRPNSSPNFGSVEQEDYYHHSWTSDKILHVHAKYKT